MLENVKIECPNCHWEPDGGAYWQCTCGHVWDTFKTTAICPSCKKRWKVTQCPKFSSNGCGEVFLHEDWYVIPTDLESMLLEKESFGI
jgi:hypothetical protein